MQNHIEIKETESGVHYVLPARKTSPFKVLGLAVIAAAAGFAIFFYFQLSLMGGIGIASSLWLVANLLLAGFIGLTGFRLLTNRTHQVVELSNGKLHCREILFPKFDWGLSLQCEAFNVTSLTIDSANRNLDWVKQYAPGANKLAEADLQIIHAMSEHGREMSLAHFYPRDVVNELSSDLLKRLGALPRPEKDPSNGVRVIETEDSVRYILPNRRFGFARYLAVGPMIPAALVLLIILPGLLALTVSSITTFAFCFLALLPVLIACGLVIAGGYRLVTNQTQQEVELKNNEIVCYEQFWTRYFRVKSKCKISQVTDIDVLAFEPTCSDLGGWKHLAKFVPETYFSAARTPKGNLLIGKAYPYETVQFLTTEIRSHIGLDQLEDANLVSEAPVIAPVSQIPLLIEMDSAQSMVNR